MHSVDVDIRRLAVAHRATARLIVQIFKRLLFHFFDKANKVHLMI